jgi:hypothetical protein
LSDNQAQQYVNPQNAEDLAISLWNAIGEVDSRIKQRGGNMTVAEVYVAISEVIVRNTIQREGLVPGPARACRMLY